MNNSRLSLDLPDDKEEIAESSSYNLPIPPLPIEQLLLFAKLPPKTQKELLSNP